MEDHVDFDPDTGDCGATKKKKRLTLDESITGTKKNVVIGTEDETGDDDDDDDVRMKMEEDGVVTKDFTAPSSSSMVDVPFSVPIKLGNDGPMDTAEFGDVQMKKLGTIASKVSKSEEWRVETRTMDNDSANRSDCSMSNESDEDIYGDINFDSEDDDDDRYDDTTKTSVIGNAFNLNLLRDSIQKNEEALPFVEGRDVIVVVGKTGTGKSTFIQGIAGKRFTKVCHSYGNSNAIGKKDVYDALQPIAGFEIGHDKCSKTNHIKCYTMEKHGKARTQTSHGNEDNSNTFFFLDTPGFEDTNGEEIDIASSAMLAQVKKKCRSIRFVVMIHYASLLDDRGGAMRSTLKFMRNFVRDFNQHKESFMFLFTHADEIKGVPESLEDAKKSLMHEIIGIMKDTKNNDDAKDLLLFMHKCLRKNYPAVDVLHPMKTNFSKITKFIESKLKPIEMFSDVGPNEGIPSCTCTLTSNSKMRLSVAISRLLSNLRLSLRQKIVNTDEVCEIQNTIQYFEKYINFEDTRAAAVDCNDLIDAHIKYLHGIISDEVKNGTSISTGTLFNECNVSLINDACIQLQAIDLTNFDVQIQRDRITCAVNRFQKKLCPNKSSSFLGLHENLQKLHAWCILDPEYKSMFNSVVADVDGVVTQVVDEVLDFHPSQFFSFSTSNRQIDEVFTSLKILKSIQENAKGLSLYLEGIGRATDAYKKFLFSSKSYFEVLGDDLASSQLDEFNFGDIQVSKNIANRILSLEAISGSIDEANAENDIFCIVQDVCRVIESHVVEKFAKSCMELEFNYQDGNNQYLSNDLTLFRGAASILSIFKGIHWKEMASSYNNLVDKIKSILMAKSGELHQVSNQMRRHGGVVDGRRDKKLLENFAPWLWFDQFLLPEQKFIESCITNIKTTYKESFSKTAEITQQMLLKLSANVNGLLSKHDLVEVTIVLKTNIIQIVNFAQFGSDDENDFFQTNSLRLFNELHRYLQSRSAYWKDLINTWVDIVSDKVVVSESLTITTEKLDAAIEEIKEVVEMQLEVSGEIAKIDSQSIKDEIIVEFSKFKQKVQRSLKSQISYDDLSVLFARVGALGNFLNTASHLPMLENLKEVARARVETDIKKIEDMVNETSEFDNIDDLIEDLEKAEVLDEFIFQKIKNRLRPLKRLREEKETDVDKVITEMIDKMSFRGLGAFLKPLASSNNQVRKNRFQISIEMIAKSLTVIDDKMRYESLGNMTAEKGRNIASYLKIMDEAHSEAGEYLCKPLFSPDLESRLKKWKQKINSNFRLLQDNTAVFIKNKDFKSVMEQKAQTVSFSSYLGNYLSEGATKMMDQNSTDFSVLIDSIPSYITKFTKSMFTEPETVEKIFSGLKCAAMVEDDGYDFPHLYIDSKTILTKEVNSLIKIVKKSAEDARCYDDSIGIINDLIKSFNLGLKHHLPPELLNESEMLIEIWTSKQKCEKNFNNAPIDTTIQEFARILDDSEPSSSFVKSFISVFTGRRASQTYERKKEELNKNIMQRYDQGRQALESRNYIKLSENLEFLRLVDSMAGNHVQLAARKLQDLERQAIQSFRALCENCQKALQTVNSREFESLFDDFRGFILYVTCLMEDIDATNSFHHTNRLVLECLCEEISSLDAVLGSFQFSAIKHKIEYVRGFGGFIADNYSLFHEELKGCSHVKNNKFLHDINTKISKHFQNGRDLKRIKYYAILGALPSVSKAEMKRAYKKKCLSSHPDKCKDPRYVQEWTDKFRMIKDARDELDAHFISDKDRSLKPFDDAIRNLGDGLRNTTNDALDEENYDLVEKLLFKLHGIEVLECLVVPTLQTDKIQKNIINLVQNHVQTVRTEIDINWSNRKYQDLNYNIKRLNTMKNKFKSHHSILTTSLWNTGICEKVESEIENLRIDACTLLENKTIASKSRTVFRQYFMKMGAILVELPEYKDQTKKVMSDLLQLCLDSKKWGYSFVFDLGQSLREDDEGKNRIAKNLLTEFSHFKQVRTMVWNEEIIQKSPEAAVKEIKGYCFELNSENISQVQLRTDTLLDQFLEYDMQYKSFLGKYLCPEADVNALTHKIIAICDTLKPVSCDDGFGAETKKLLPTIMAGFFAVFTIFESGESYNRLGEDTNGDGIDAQRMLMKPHNIQILSLLSMFGCGTAVSKSLKSQAMQIRTGEGKSMILGAAAAIFGLLGFRVNCVCYSKDLSTRDYERFHDVFDHFGLSHVIKYSTIDTLILSQMKKKGDIFSLTHSLLHGTLKQHGIRRCTRKSKEEILLVDEVDVFFGSEFYGRTLNLVQSLKGPEVSTILTHIWDLYNDEGKELLLSDIKALAAYDKLILMFPEFKFFIDNEILMMLNSVRQVDNPPYHLDDETDRIGYKQHDTISYSTFYGYKTKFAYLKEADKGNLKNKNEALSQNLALSIPCGSFSYANIEPNRIIGLSGTLEVMCEHEKSILKKYGINQHLFIPSVYGETNASFDKAGNGISIEKGLGNYFHKITKEIKNVTSKKNRAVIVFFCNQERLNEYKADPLYRKLGQKKEMLTEEKSANEKAYMISKAATAGQITLCTSIFGRGTDFFCSNETLEENGGVHVIQTFLSANTSEEIQIKGRTARQGKRGSYELVLLDNDLKDNFGIELGSSDDWPEVEVYKNLCDARGKGFQKKKFDEMEKNIILANEKHQATHKYFDALLDSDTLRAMKLLKDMYVNAGSST